MNASINELTGDSRQRGPFLFALAVSLYVVLAMFRQQVVFVFLGERSTTAPVPTIANALAIQAVQCGLLSVIASILIVSIRVSRKPGMPSRRTNLRTLVVVLVFTTVISLLLNALSLWPFTWRWGNSGVAQYMGLLVEQKRTAAIILWALNGTLLVPIIEETIFRFWLLRLLTRWSNSPLFAIGASSLLFALLHLGNPFALPDRFHLTNAAWLFSFSLLAGHMTVRSKGSIGPALAMHCGRNTLELATLAFSVTLGYSH